ncbi:unnamed protein product [Camellia sinensis]
MEWVRGDLLGHGSFGTVNLGIPKSQSLQFPPLMAVKTCGSSHSALLDHEKSILQQLKDCPQIIECFGGDFSFENGEKLYNLFLEYAMGGSLADKLKNSGHRSLPESEVRRHTESILKGLQCIHENGFVHCDLKLQNVLLCQNDVAKIADFGLAKKSGEKIVGFELRGTPMYMPPETVVAGEQEAAADVWALGCLVAEMVAGTPPWRCSAEGNVCGLLMRIGFGEEVPEIPGKLSEEGKDFLGKCFVKDPRKRWTAEMLLNHPFVVDHGDDHDHYNTRVVALEETCDATSSSSYSPRGPFDFLDSELVQSSCSFIKPLPSPEYSPAERLRRLVTEERPDWSVTDSWVTVR